MKCKLQFIRIFDGVDPYIQVLYYLWLETVLP